MVLHAPEVSYMEQPSAVVGFSAQVTHAFPDFFGEPHLEKKFSRV